MKLIHLRLAALFLVSVCVLAFEIEVMRVFSVASWSNFGAMVISIALLGFGLAGTLLTFLSARVRRKPDLWLVFSSFALGPSMAVAHVLAQLVPFNPVLIASDPAQLAWIGAYYAIYSVPFFAGGLFIGVAFTALASQTHKLYFWNMLGSGLGGLFILALMYALPPAALIYPLVGLGAVPALLCCVWWSPVEGRFHLRSQEAVLFSLLTGLCFLLLAHYGALSVSDFKPISYARKYPDAALVYSGSSPRGEMEVYSSSYFHFAPGLSDNASLAAGPMPQNAFLGLFTDGNGPVGIMRKLGPEEDRYLDFLPMAAPYLLMAQPKVLILRLGGGAGVHTALHEGAREIRVVEPDADLIHMLKDVPYFRAYTGGMLQDPRVKVTSGEARAFAGTTREKFDLVEIGLVDSIGLSQAGGYSVEENYLYTVEAIRDYLRCLAPDGILSITVWDRLNPPRNVPKLLASVAEAIRGDYEESPQKRVFAFNLLLSTATVLVKKSDFLPQETALLRDFCRRMSFDVDYYPGMTESPESLDSMLQGYASTYAPHGPRGPGGRAPGKAEAPENLRPGDFYGLCLQEFAAFRQHELFSRYFFDIRPATDDRPYYSGYIKPRTIPLLLKRLGGISEEWGYLLLLGTLLQSLLFALVVIALPFIFRRRELFAGRPGTVSIILYYGCLGLGYMMAEIFLIQRFAFFLADPVYANAVVITALLVSSGTGSLLSGRTAVPRTTVVRSATAALLVLILACFIGLPLLLRALLGLPLAVKALAAVIIVAPLGLCMGVQFPAGLSALSENRREILPWAWGMNGALSVTGSVLTRVISVSAGFTVVLACVAGLYAAAGLLYRANEEGRLPARSSGPLRGKLAGP
jgi:Spermine/spermidine synthase domain